MQPKRITAVSFIMFLFSSFSVDKGIYNIVDYGAKADGKTINTDAINNTIKTCNSNGGGTVEIPPGNFITSTNVLLSNVELHLDFGARLIGSKDTSDYLLQPRALFNEGYNRYGLLYAQNAENIAITGFGEIDGSGTSFMNGLDKPHMGHDFDRKFTRQKENFMKVGAVFEDGPVSYPFRPGLLITMLQCENIHLKDITLKDAPEWTIRFGNCDKVDVNGITIQNNPLIPNNDGIHCTTSKNITITNCKIFTGDDAIIVTGFGEELNTKDSAQQMFANKTGIAENVSVTNCVLSSRSACIRIGYGEHPIRNLVFSNLVMETSNRGIGIFARNGSSIDNVLFDNIIINTHIFSGHWWGKGEPIHISALRDAPSGTAGTIKNIHFSNITATAETGILIQGSNIGSIENISFDGLRLTINNGKYSKDYGGNFDLRPAYPVDSAIFKHDIPGIYAQYVQGLYITNTHVDWGTNLSSYFTNGILIDHYDDVSIDHTVVSPAFKNFSAVKLSKGTNTFVTDCRTTKGFQLLQKENAN